MLEIISCAVIFILTWLLLGRSKKSRKFPDGPTGIPILGYLPWLAPKVHINLGILGKNYGDIFSVRLGCETFVILNSYETINKAMKHDVLAGRPQQMFLFQSFQHGIFVTQGAEWQERRRFALKTLKEFGFGHDKMEVILQKNVQELVENFRKTSGSPQRLSPNVSSAVQDVLWQLLSGPDPKGRAKAQKVYQLANEGVEAISTSGLLHTLPWLARMFPKLCGLETMYRAKDELHGLFTEVYNEHLEKFQPEAEPSDYVFALLKKMHEIREVKTSTFRKEAGLSYFLDDLSLLLMASAEPITATVDWVILFLLKNPEKLLRMREEVDRVLGRRMANFSDKIKMPYTEAVIHETFRLATIAPESFPHTAMEDTWFEGFFLPKGTIITPNIYQVHRDPEYWSNPEEFIPERFLTEETDGSLKFHKDERVIPFGVGKRECIAINVAPAEVFVIVASLIQHFEIKAKGTLPENEVNTAFVLAPEKYEIICTTKNESWETA